MIKRLDDSSPTFRPARAARHGQLGPGATPATKRAVNVSIDAEILAAARTLGINLSQLLEDELRIRTKEAREAVWREDNRAFTESYNAYIERNGVFGEEFQDWDDPSV